MAFSDLVEGILELFGDSQGSAPYVNRLSDGLFKNSFRFFRTEEERYHEDKSSKVCPRHGCGVRIVGENTYCGNCTAKISKSLTARRAMFRVQGRCGKCGGTPDGGKSLCAPCAEKNRVYNERARNKKRAA